MLEANKGKRKQKQRGEILQTATEHIESYGGYFKGQRIYNTLVDVWTTAWCRAMAKTQAHYVEQAAALEAKLKEIQEQIPKAFNEGLLQGKHESNWEIIPVLPIKPGDEVLDRNGLIGIVQDIEDDGQIILMDTDRTYASAKELKRIKEFVDGNRPAIHVQSILAMKARKHE